MRNKNGSIGCRKKKQKIDERNEVMEKNEGRKCWKKEKVESKESKRRK